MSEEVKEVEYENVAVVTKRSKLGDLGDKISERFHKTVAAVKEHPFLSIGTLVALGFAGKKGYDYHKSSHVEDVPDYTAESVQLDGYTPEIPFDESSVVSE